jgi:malate dehydrogenase (oxaloacetate-decarboxylating)(NADP+)
VQGLAIFASRNAFDPVECNEKVFMPGQVLNNIYYRNLLSLPKIFEDIIRLLVNPFIQANNAYIFPGFGLGLIISGAIRVHDDMLLAACMYINIHVLTRHTCFLIFPFSFICFIQMVHGLIT